MNTVTVFPGRIPSVINRKPYSRHPLFLKGQTRAKVDVQEPGFIGVGKAGDSWVWILERNQLTEQLYVRECRAFDCKRGKGCRWIEARKVTQITWRRDCGHFLDT